MSEGGRERTAVRGVATASVAAFFDLDGTLVPEPSLERRLLRFLYGRREWTPRSLARWVARYLKVCALPKSMAPEQRWVMATHGNKAYWKNVRVASAEEFGAQAPRIEFFVEGIRRMRWHVSQGHKIILVSGTLESLAQVAADELKEKLRLKALPDAIGVCATRLAENAGRWTGEVSGEAIWGRAKSRATERLAREQQIDLGRSFAYANTASDCAMLAKVGYPVAVNPTRGLRRVAKAAGWPIVLWKDKKKPKTAKRRPAPLRAIARDSAQAGLHGRSG